MKQKESLRAKLVKRYLRFGIRKFTIGVASVAIASGLMMIGSHQIQAEETAPTSPTVTKQENTDTGVKKEQTVTKAEATDNAENPTTKTTVTIKFVSEGTENNSLEKYTVTETGNVGETIPESSVQVRVGSGGVITTMGYTVKDNPFLKSEKPKFGNTDKEIVITLTPMKATGKTVYAFQGEKISEDTIKEAVATEINTNKEVVENSIPSTVEEGKDNLNARVKVTYGSNGHVRDELVDVPVKILPTKSVTSGITVLKGTDNNTLINKVREHVTKELAGLTNLPSGVTATIKDGEGYATPDANENQDSKMDVTIQYKKGETVIKETAVEVPIKVVSSIVKSLAVVEGTTIPAETVKNSVKPGKGGEVELPDANAIPDTTGKTKVEVPVKVKYRTDKAHPDLVEEVTVSILVVAKPKPITVEEGTTITEELVKQQITLPEGSNIKKIGAIPDTKTAGKKENISVTIELKDGQTLTLHVPVTVTAKVENGGNHSNQGEHSNNNVISPKPSETVPSETVPSETPATKTTVTIKFVSEGTEIQGHTITETGMEGNRIPENNVQTHIDVIKSMGYKVVLNPFLSSEENKPKFDKNVKEIVITLQPMHATVQTIYALQGETVSEDAVKSAVTTEINTVKEVVTSTIPSTNEAGNDSLKARVIVKYGSGNYMRDEEVEVPVKVLPTKSVTSGITVLKGIENNTLINKVREHVTKELAGLTNLPSGVTATIKDSDAYVTPDTNENKDSNMNVTIQYKNGDTVLKETTVEVPIKVVSSTVKSFAVVEGTKIPATTVKNSVDPGAGGEVELPDANAIPDTTGKTTVEVPVKVKYGTDKEHPDLVEEVTVSVLVVAKPKPISVEEGTTITEELVKQQITLPENSKIKAIGAIPDTKTTGKKENISVTIELKDGQTLTLHVPVTVTAKVENGGNHSSQGEHSNNNVISPKPLETVPSETKPTETNQTGWNFVNGKWYYKKDGKNITKKWEKINGKWYFFTPSGDIKNNGWEFVNGKWYYLEPSGAMKASQWFKSGGKWFYVNHSGVMETGWLQVNGKWYYLEPSGAMKASQWFKLNEKWYYVNDSGELLVNTITPDGYKVNENGEWINE